MPSFDIASKADLQVLDNALNVARKEIANRYDFKGSHVAIELEKKSLTVRLEADSEMKLKQVEDVLISKAMKQGLDVKCFDFSKDFVPSGKVVRKDVPVRNGLDRDNAKKIVKLIKDTGLKVQAAVMDDIVRVSGKKLDDLQAVIQAVNGAGLDLPLQYTNRKS